MPESGVLSKTDILNRFDRNSYKTTFGHVAVAPDELWRNESQPGNALDERDERCTAQSRPGQQPEFEGIDDYECDGRVLHYTMCQVSMI